MATYLVQKDNKLAIAMVERIQNSNESFVLCSTEELREFNNSVIVLPEEQATTKDAYFSSLTYSDTLKQAQREYNLKMARMAEKAALGVQCYVSEPIKSNLPKKIPRSHFIHAAESDIAMGINPTSAYSNLQMLMSNFIEEDE